MKFLLKLRFVIALIILMIFFKNFFIGRYSLASNIRDGEVIFKNVCASCHVRGGLVISKGSKSLKFSDLEQRGIADIDSIKKIANDGIGYMKGYKSKLKGDEDKVLAEWLIQQSKEGWKQ
tara:strand:+ start:247 stop:606 length:360 start_codon:yes stop_codon:yes gene_type:complete